MSGSRRNRSVTASVRKPLNFSIAACSDGVIAFIVAVMSGRNLSNSAKEMTEMKMRYVGAGMSAATS
jgi:hypothetical protein